MSSILSPTVQRVLDVCDNTPKRLVDIQASLFDLDPIRVRRILGSLVENGYVVNHVAKSTPGVNPRGLYGLYTRAVEKKPSKRKIRSAPVLSTDHMTHSFALQDIWR